VSAVRLEVEEGVATITLAAPERRNAITVSLARAIIEACEVADADETVGAVVVMGEGGFCAGASQELLAAATEDPLREPVRAELHAVYESFARVGRLEAPSIAAVTGAAVGAGVNLALATDLRIMASDARLITGFLRLGLHPGGGHLALLGRLVGREAVAALGVFGEEIDGARAHAIGLAWEVVPEERVLARAKELARRVARDPELARATAAALRLELGPPAISWAAALQAETAMQAWSLRRAAGRLFTTDRG
jgi:enoyl-CoA hydratase